MINDTDTFSIPGGQTETGQIKKFMESDHGVNETLEYINSLYEKPNDSQPEKQTIFGSETFVVDPFKKQNAHIETSAAQNEALTTQEMRPLELHELGEALDAKQIIELVNGSTARIDFVRNAKLNGINDPYNLAGTQNNTNMSVNYGLAA